MLVWHLMRPDLIGFHPLRIRLKILGFQIQMTLSFWRPCVGMCGQLMSVAVSATSIQSDLIVLVAKTVDVSAKAQTTTNVCSVAVLTIVEHVWIYPIVQMNLHKTLALKFDVIS